jgi:hypothetical protein
LVLKIAEIEDGQIFPDRLFRLILAALRKIGPDTSVLLKNLSIPTLFGDAVRGGCPSF